MSQVKKLESQALDLIGTKKQGHLFVTDDGVEYGQFCSEPVCLLCVQDEAIQRVRELANELNNYDWKSNEASYTLSGHLIATQILKALEGVE